MHMFHWIPFWFLWSRSCKDCEIRKKIDELKNEYENRFKYSKKINNRGHLSKCEFVNDEHVVTCDYDRCEYCFMIYAPTFKNEQECPVCYKDIK